MKVSTVYLLPVKHTELVQRWRDARRTFIAPLEAPSSPQGADLEDHLCLSQKEERGQRSGRQHPKPGKSQPAARNVQL